MVQVSNEPAAKPREFKLILQDLPEEATKSMIEACLQSKTGIVLGKEIQIWKDAKGPFQKAILQFENEKELQQALSVLRYFELVDGKHSRGQIITSYENGLSDE